MLERKNKVNFKKENNNEKTKKNELLLNNIKNIRN